MKSNNPLWRLVVAAVAIGMVIAACSSTGGGASGSTGGGTDGGGHDRRRQRTRAGMTGVYRSPGT